MLPLVTDLIFVGDGVDSMFVYTGNWSGRGTGFTKSDLPGAMISQHSN